MQIRVTPRRRSRRKLALVAIPLAAALVVAGCSSSKKPSSSGGGNGSSSKGDINVAVVGDLTGPIAATVSPSVSGILTAIKEINKNGGINGRQVKVSGPYDSASTTAGGTQAAQRAVAAKPDFIVSGSNSTSMAGAVTVYKSANVTVIANGGGTDTFEPALPWHFSLSFDGAMQSLALYGAAKSGANNQPFKLGIIGLESPSVDGVVTVLQGDASKNQATVVDTERTPATLTVFTSQAAKMAAAKPDAIFTIDSLTATVLEVSALKTAGFTGKIYSTYGAASTAALQKINNANFSANRAARVPTQGDPLYTAAQDAGYAKDTESQYFAFGYALPYVISAVVPKCDSPCNVANFAKAADSAGDITVPDNALFGPIHFTSTDHSGITKVQFYRWDPSKSAVVSDGDPVTVSS